MPDVSSPLAPLKHLYLQAYRFQGNCIIHFEKPFYGEPPDGRFQRYEMGVEMDCADRRLPPPVFLLRIASISASAAEKLKHVSMCCENTGGPAGAKLLANWTGNKNGNLQSGHGFGFGPSSICPLSHPLIPNGGVSASLHPSMQDFHFCRAPGQNILRPAIKEAEHFCFLGVISPELHVACWKEVKKHVKAGWNISRTV